MTGSPNGLQSVMCRGVKSDAKEKEPIPSIPVFEEESELEITESIDFQQQNW